MTDPTNGNPNQGHNAGNQPAPSNSGGIPPGNGGEPQPAAPTWLKVWAGVTGSATLLFFMLLIFMALFGFTIPDNSRYLVAILFGIFGGLSFAFISGTAMASGYIPIPGTTARFSFSAGGGVATTIIFAGVGYWMTRAETLPVLAGIDNVQTFAAMDPKTVTVQVDYHLQGWEATQSAFLEASWKADFAQSIRKTFDRPLLNQMTFDLDLDGAKEATPFWIRIRVQDRQGRDVAKSNTWEAKTPKE